MGSIDSRLRRLEERRSGDRCTECELARDERREMAVVYEEDPERSFRGDPDEACAGCGQPLYCVINVVYNSPKVGEGGGRR